MSRRSSITSLTTSASGSTSEDPLMRDCYDLRRRLLQTEQSIKNLNPPFISSSLIGSGQPSSDVQTKLPPPLHERQTNLNSDFRKLPSEPSDVPPVLTLADLSPATSDTLSNFEFHEKMNSSFHLPVQSSRPSISDPKHRNRQSGSDIDQCSVGSGDDYGGESLRKKLNNLREKNTSLVSQNHKLMSELENLAYELHQEHNNVKILTADLEKEKKGVQDYEDRVVALEREISLQHDAHKSSEDNLLLATEHLQEKTNELNNVTQSCQSVQVKYQEELKLRKHLQSQLQETLRNVEELTSKMTEDKEREKEQNKLRCEQLEKMDRELNDLTNERNELLAQNTSLDGQVMELREEIRLLQREGVTNEEYRSSLERDNAELRSTVARQSQRVGKLEKQSPRNEENFKLHEIIKTQNEKIHYYQQLIEQSKEDMLRLESLVQKVQEQSFRRDLYHTPSTVDSGISRSTGVIRENGGTMNGLRSELSFIVERNRMNDKKQQELEEIISKMEDEAVTYSSQLIQLEEKLAEKTALNVSLESKVNQQNLRVVDIKTELENTTNKNNELHRQIHRKSLDVENLERQLTEKISDLSSYLTRLQEMEQSIEQKEHYISELETTLKTKEEGIDEHRHLLEKTRNLHSEHCKELESQIEQLQKEYEGKNNQVSHLDTVLKANRQDLVAKTARVNELEKALEGLHRELDHRSKQSAEYEEMLAKLQEKARMEDQRGLQMDKALKECQEEMQVHIKQLETTKHTHQQDMKSKLAEVNKLKEILERYKGDYHKRCEESEQLEKTLAERTETLKLCKKRMSEQENNQKRLQQQVGILELELARERETNGEEVKNLQSLLENARQDLDERTKQLNELNTSLVGVHKDMKQSSSHVVDLEQLLQQTRELLDKKCQEINDLTDTLKQNKHRLDEDSEKCKELEGKLIEKKEKLKERDEQVVKLDGELSKAQREIEETVHQLEALKDVLQDNKRELKEKEEKMSELDKELNESQELLQKKDKELHEKDARVLELDQTVRECQWELKQRVTEMSKLDVSMKEQRSDLKQKTNVLEHSLSQYQYELSQKALEISELKAKFAQNQEQLKQKTVRLEYMENTMKEQQQELRKRMDQVTEFENEFAKLKIDSEDKSELTQELRLAREQVQNTHSDLLDARRKLLQFEHKQHELLEELQEAHGLLVNKEADCTRLAKELGSAQVREAQAEARCLQEVRRVEQQYSLKIANYENEIQQLRESHSKLFSQKEEEVATHRINTQNLRENEKANEKEIKRLKDEQKTFSEHVDHLKDQLNQLQEQIFAANETIVIKESEIARLQAKVSGYERATFGSKLHFDHLDSRSPSTHMRSSNPPSDPGNSKLSHSNYQTRTPVKRSSSAHDLHKASTSLISFGDTSHETYYDERENSPVIPTLALLSTTLNASSRTDDNTFERLFDKARQQLDAAEKKTENETWTSLRGAAEDQSVEQDDVDVQ